MTQHRVTLLVKRNNMFMNKISFPLVQNYQNLRYDSIRQPKIFHLIIFAILQFPKRFQLFRIISPTIKLPKFS